MDKNNNIIKLLAIDYAKTKGYTVTDILNMYFELYSDMLLINKLLER